jgi:hypothetical protein
VRFSEVYTEVNLIRIEAYLFVASRINPELVEVRCPELVEVRCPELVEVRCPELVEGVKK